jgi:PAS domain S-box-containing protein
MRPRPLEQSHERIHRYSSERKRAEKKLRESEERYRSLFDRMLDGVYLSTHEGRFVDVNPAFVKMFGYASRQEMLKIADIKKELYFSPEERGSHLLDTGQEEVEAYPMRRKDGSEIWVEDHGRYVHDEQGNIVYHEGILRDVTERKRLEEELQRYSEHLQELVDERTHALRESERATRHQADQLAALDETVLEITKTTDLIRPLDAIVERAVKLLVAEGGAAYLCDPQKLEARCVVSYKTSSVTGTVLKYGEGAAGTVAKTGQPLIIDDYEAWSGRARVFSNMQFGAILSAPLIWQGQVIGVINVLGGESRRFTQDDLKLLTRFANHAAIALHRRRMEELVGERTRELLESEGQLRSTKERLEYVIQSNPAVIYSGKPLTDFSDWELTFVSDRVVSMLGYEPEGFVGSLEFWYSHVHPDALQDIPRLNQTLWREGHRTFEYQFQHKDGSYRWIHDEASTTRSSEGKPVAVYGYWTDITAQKQAEQALRKSESEYRRLFESSPISLWEEDFSAVKQFLDELRQKGVSDLGAYFATHPKDVEKCAGLVKVLNVNQATLRLYEARSVNEISGGLSAVLTEDSNRKQFADELLALARGEKYYEAEMDNKTLFGETKHCNVICAVVPGYEQSLARVLVCIVDLTPQKQLQAELVKSQRLAAIGETAAMVGHDLRNPLQGIAGAAYNIRRHLRNALDPSTKEMLAVIDNGVQYANEIINDLLEFSREIQLQLLPTTPKSVVRKTLADVKVPNNIAVEDTTLNGPEILADEAKVKRLLTNLIQNAIDAMPEGGKLSISSMNTQKEVSISIRDTGFGIPKEMVDKLWMPLSTTKAKGVGLGLPICKRIIEAHGGSISVESTIGRGTTFTLKLPIQTVQSGVNQNE